jgi:CheY-like chemotaxis protein
MFESSRARVLVVEDEMSFQELYEDLLSSLYDISIVGSKEEAIARLRQQSFDVALIDMRLQGGKIRDTDGLDVADFIRDMNFSTAIILNSGFPTQTPEIEERMKRLHVTAVLDKSLESPSQQFLDAVARGVAQYVRGEQ